MTIQRTTKPLTAEEREDWRRLLKPTDPVLRLLDDYEVLKEAAKNAISRNLSYYDRGSQAYNAKQALEWALEGKDAKPVRYV